jgi:hypothetical protein
MLAFEDSANLQKQATTMTFASPPPPAESSKASIPSELDEASARS